jgi:hypothetical protein
MDELALLKDMADTTPLPDSEDLAPARDRLMSAMAAVTTEGAGSRPAARQAKSSVVRRRTTNRRLWWSGAAVVGLAAAITAVVAVGGLEPVGVAPPKASAAEILHEAAAAARKLPDTPARPDQFIYTKTQNGDGSVREAWLSADGTHDGLIKQQGENIPLPGCRDGRSQGYKGDKPVAGGFQECVPTPAYLPDLPTDAAGMREYLMNMPGSKDRTNSLAKNILFLVGENYVSPASLAALFETVAQLDGLTIVEHAKDGAGRPGVGVSWTYTNTITMVFDRDTHAFLGIADADAIVQQAVVDAAGQRP